MFNQIRQDEQNSDINNTVVEIKNNNQTKTNESLICPECGGELLLRTAKYGEHTGENFYGCSNYPKCKYIRKL